MKKLFILFFTPDSYRDLFSLPIVFGITFAQTAEIKSYPTNWWVGMKNPKLQLMVHATDIGNATGFSTNYPGIKIEKVNKVENKNYVFLDLVISSGKPGIVIIKVNPASFNDISFELKARRKNENGKSRIQGVNASDLIYLIMPDRFSNGDPSNDQFADMRDPVLDRSNSLLRHGGDLQGITNHLDYIKDLGVTALWLTPVVENNMPTEKEPPGAVSGYHGYWITDHYEIDKRFGGKRAYVSMIEEAHKKGLKVIGDAVYNHVGQDHWFIHDRPMKDWINNWPSYQGTHHREEVFIDPYVSKIDKKIMVDGWFVPHLPDLNLANPYMANYIIQNTIWATEEFGIDGWRVDTYKYNEEKFLNRINKALLEEFPGLTIFGEVTSNTVPPSAYFTDNNMILPMKHTTQGVTDFPVSNAMLAGMNEKFGWTNGVNRLYMALSQDGLYKDPKRNCIFLDNHDADRVFTVIGEDVDKLKMGINWLLTLRGIPQMYYGTEILMKNSRNPSDGQVRLDFPGGWPGDKEDKFTRGGRNEKENIAFEHVRRLAGFRKKSSALATGKMLQFIPDNGLYVYFRYDKNQTIMVVSNTSDKEEKLKTDRYKEILTGYTKGRDIQTGKVVSIADIQWAPKASGVYELQK